MAANIHPTAVIADDAVNPQQVAHNEGDFRLPVIQHETPRVKLVVDVFRRKRHEPTDDVAPDLGRDDAGGRPGAKRLGSKER